MRLVSFNIALFEPNNEKLQEFIKKQNPDILCLQEVTRRVDKNAFEEYVSKDAIDEVSSDLGFSFFAPDWLMKGFEAKNFHGQQTYRFDLGGFVEFGKYIKSRFKILKGQSIFTQQSFSLITEEYWSKWPKDDCKSFQVVDIKINDQKLRVVNYHGIWSQNKQDSELTIKASEKIKQFASGVNYPVIICGDFNLFPNTKSIKILSNSFISLIDKFNIKTTRPKSNELNHIERNIVDFIFVSKDIQVKNFEVLDSDVSDHRPLILDFEL